MKKVLLIICSTLVCLCSNAQYHVSFERNTSKKDVLYRSTIENGITYTVNSKRKPHSNDYQYFANALDTTIITSHVSIPSSVTIDGDRYPVERITLKYENHSSIRFSSTIEYIDFRSSHKTKRTKYEWEDCDRKIDNTNDNPFFVELSCAKPPCLHKFGCMGGLNGWRLEAIFTNPEKVVLIVPRQYVETYKKSEQWEGAQVFSSKEEYYSYRKEKDRQEVKEKAEREEQARIEREKAQQEKEARELQARLEKERREAEQEEMYNALVGTWREKTVKKRKKKSRNEVCVLITRNHLTIKCDKWKPWEGYDGPFSMWIENGEWRFNPSKWSYEEIIEEKKSRGYWDNNPTYSYHRVNYKCSLEMGEDNTLWLIRDKYWRIQLVKDTE